MPAAAAAAYSLSLLLPCRGRFLELHVDELPDTELGEILGKRCGIAPSYATKMVAVMRELQRRRQAANVSRGGAGWMVEGCRKRGDSRGADGVLWLEGKVVSKQLSGRRYGRVGQYVWECWGDRMN